MVTVIRRNISEIIKQLVEKFGKSPAQINSGDCAQFAAQLSKSLPDSRIISTGGWPEDPDIVPTAGDFEPVHSFVYYKKKYYDAEAPEGVTDYHDLPLFKRWARGCPSEYEAYRTLAYLTSKPCTCRPMGRTVAVRSYRRRR